MRAQIDQTRQEAGQRLAAAGRRDQKRRAAGMRLRQKFELMRAWGPAAAGEPARENFRKQCRSVDDRHAPWTFSALAQSDGQEAIHREILFGADGGLFEGD
jgi:hypothetical protein